MFELYINNRRLNLSESSVFSLNFLFEDFTNLNERRAFFSRTIEVPSTPTNDIILGSCLSPITAISPFNNYNEFEVIRNGISIMKGTQILARKSVRGSERFYEINLFSFTSSIAERLANVRLHELDLGVYTITSSYIINSWSNNGLTGNYVVPLVQRWLYLESVTPTTDLSPLVHSLYPHVFANAVLREGFKKIGYQFSSKVLSGKYRDLCTHYNRVDIGQTKEFLASLNSSMYMNVFSSNSLSGAPVLVDGYSSGSGNPTYRDLAGGYFISSSGGTHKFRLKGNLIGNVTTTTSHTYKLEIYNLSTSEVVYEFPDIIRYGGSYFFYKFDVETTINLTNSHKYGVRLTQTFSPTPTTVPVWSLSDFTYSIEPVKLLNTFGQKFDVAKYLPDISLLEYIKQLLILFNGYLYEENGTVYIEAANDFFLPESYADDWSEKIVHDSIELSSVNEGYKEYLFSYTNNKEEPYIKLHKQQKNREVGERSYKISTPQANASTYEVKVNGSATHDRILISGKNIPSIGVVENEDAGLRFLMYAGLTSGTFKFLGTTYNKYPMCYFNMQGKPSLDFDSVEGATGLVYLFYSERLKQIESGVKLRCNVLLNENDILNLSFRRPKIITFPDGNYAYFYLLKINDYSGNGATECEFIQLKNGTE